MARYGGDQDRNRMGLHDFAEHRGHGGRSGYGYGGAPGDYRGGYGGGGYRNRSAGMIGGMRSDAGASRWDRFPGEEGWFGEGFAGYPGGDVRGGARGYGGEFRGGRYGGEFRGRSRGGQGRRGMGYGTEYGGERGYRHFPGQDRSGFAGVGGRSDADRIRARDIMTDEPTFVTPDASVTEVAAKMRDLNVGIVPVVDSEDNRRLRGVVTDRDLAIRVLAAGKDGKAKVRDFMTDQIETVNQNDTVHRILDVMKREQVRRVPVTDREGRLVGVVAQADLAVRYAGLDLQRETEVEEAIERISEPAEPRR